MLNVQDPPGIYLTITLLPLWVYCYNHTSPHLGLSIQPMHNNVLCSLSNIYTSRPLVNPGLSCEWYCCILNKMLHWNDTLNLQYCLAFCGICKYWQSLHLCLLADKYPTMTVPEWSVPLWKSRALEKIFT